jgi:YHS domain-containing protein
MVKDPVCGMQVDPQKAAAQSVHNGQTYYFCSMICKGVFDRDPEKYASQTHQEDTEHSHHH